MAKSDKITLEMNEDPRCRTDTYEVTVKVEQFESGVLYQFEDWRLDGYLHRDLDQPARIWRNPDTGIVLLEEYFRFGQNHRDQNLGPAITSYDQQGPPERTVWCVDGKKHRDGDEPAVLHIDLVPGVVTAEL